MAELGVIEKRDLERNTVKTFQNVEGKTDININGLVLYDNVDPTKKVKFNTTGVLTGTTVDLAVPAASGTLALDTDITNNYRPLTKIKWDGTQTLAVLAGTTTTIPLSSMTKTNYGADFTTIATDEVTLNRTGNFLIEVSGTYVVAAGGTGSLTFEHDGTGVFVQQEETFYIKNDGAVNITSGFTHTILMSGNSGTKFRFKLTSVAATTSLIGVANNYRSFELKISQIIT